MYGVVAGEYNLTYKYTRNIRFQSLGEPSGISVSPLHSYWKSSSDTSLWNICLDSHKFDGYIFNVAIFIAIFIVKIISKSDVDSASALFTLTVNMQCFICVQRFTLRHMPQFCTQTHQRTQSVQQF